MGRRAGTPRRCVLRHGCQPSPPAAWRTQITGAIASLGRQDILRVLTAP